MKIKQLYLGHLVTLLTGSLIYILFRTSTLRMFTWFDSLGIMELINKARAISILHSGKLPDFVLYALPDGFWMFSYMSLMLYVWKNELNRENMFWIFILPVVAVLSELGQLIQIIPGTFDLLDLFMYLSGALLPFIIYKKSITINLIQV